MLWKVISKNIFKTIDFRQKVALLDKAGELLSSKAQMLPQSVQKIHQELFDSLQDVSEGSILKPAAKISNTKGKNKGKKPSTKTL